MLQTSLLQIIAVLKICFKITASYLSKSGSQCFNKSTNLYNLVRSLTQVSVSQSFLGMTNTHDSYYVAEKSVARIKDMEPVQLRKMIQPDTELWNIIDPMLVIRIKIFRFNWKKVLY